MGVLIKYDQIEPLYLTWSVVAYIYLHFVCTSAVVLPIRDKVKSLDIAIHVS